MIIGLVIVLIITLVLPFSIKSVEHNLEIFLFIMGVTASLIAGSLSRESIIHIAKNEFLYMITFVVLAISLIFKFIKSKVKSLVNLILKGMSLRVFVFIMVIILGLVSGIITAIIASLILVEIISVLPTSRDNKVKLNIISCFSIGIGSALTPIGEPISTIVVSKLNADFSFMFNLIGVYAVGGVILLAFLAMYFAKDKRCSKNIDNNSNNKKETSGEQALEEETYKEIGFRTVKIFVFIVALELLGNAFKPLIDTYVINLDSRLLYWGNMVSAVLDNATIAAAEIGPNMSLVQIRALLMGLLVSGGMLIPGNIPNIITANKLKIKSSEWIKVGVPIGLVMLLGYYIVLF